MQEELCKGVAVRSWGQSPSPGLLFHPTSGSTPSCRAPPSLSSPWPCPWPSQPTLTMITTILPDLSPSEKKDQTPRFQDLWTIVERVIDPWKCNFSRNICVLKIYLVSRGHIIWNNIFADPERISVAVAESCAQRKGWVKCTLASSPTIPDLDGLAAFNLNCYCPDDNIFHNNNSLLHAYSTVLSVSHNFFSLSCAPSTHSPLPNR